MKHLLSSMRRMGQGRRRTRLSRILRGTLYVKLGLALALGLVTGLIYLRLKAGPLSISGLSDRVSGAIAARIGPDWKVVLNTSAIALEEGSLALRASGLEIRNPEGLLVVRAPDAVVSVDTGALLSGNLQPRSIDFRELQVRAAINRDGSISFVAAEGSEPQAVTWPPPGLAPLDGPRSTLDPGGSAVASAVASLFDLVLEPRGVVGAIDRARITNAKLTLIDADQRERVAFANVNGSFERTGPASRRFELRMEGPRGRWRVNGNMQNDGDGREGMIAATEVPIDDLLLLSGLSKVPATTELKASGQVNAAFVGGRLSRFDARFATDSGTIQIDDKDMPPIDVETAKVDAAWDEARRAVALRGLAFHSGKTDIRLRGEFIPSEGSGWRMSLAGRDAVLKGVEPGDRPIRLNSIDAALSGRDGIITVEKLAMRGPSLDGLVEGSFDSASEPKMLRVKIKASDTDARTALRLWPEAIVAKLRAWLGPNLRGGTLESLDLTVVMSDRDIAKGIGPGPIPDEAVKIAFAVRDAELKVADGLPPLVGLATRGFITGTTASLQAPRAQVALPDGRLLALSDGVFTVANTWSKESEAKVAFKVEGGADGVAAFLQSPLIRGAAAELDPEKMKGRADLKVDLRVPLRRTPSVSDLPLSVAGAIGGLTMDKAFGKERLEGANLNVAYSNGSVSIKGEGRLWGVPAQIDLRQPKEAAGEAVVNLTLDEAARTRKGLSFGPQLTGPVPVRVVLPVGGMEKAGARVEADLTRAVVDNLVPGWVKPTGKPGKLSFTVPDGTTELRDFALDSGTVQMRGTLTLSADGQLDKADLTSFKLSPGDDLRVQLERSGSTYRIAARGPIADARPFIRSMTAPAKEPGSNKDAKESKDIEIDFSTNILTGFNDEALTAVSIKAALRNRELRQLHFTGRLRSSTVTAQLAKVERGPQVLVLESPDAGGTLRFVDIYKRMHGGTLSLQVTTGDTPQHGVVTIQNFVLRDEPALKNIASQGQQLVEERAILQKVPKIDANEIEFTRLQAEFGRTATRLEFRDATMWGGQVGFKATGWIDYGRDRADITGTFVPAYGINNAFAQVPLIGPLLGGGTDEGLFAVNFRIAGQASSPTLTVNPLSAVAPGFLRKILGAMTSGPSDPSSATAAPATRVQR